MSLTGFKNAQEQHGALIILPYMPGAELSALDLQRQGESCHNEETFFNSYLNICISDRIVLAAVSFP